jgi:hypothetical protein
VSKLRIVVQDEGVSSVMLEDVGFSAMGWQLMRSDQGWRLGCERWFVVMRARKGVIGGIYQ